MRRGRGGGTGKGRWEKGKEKGEEEEWEKEEGKGEEREKEEEENRNWNNSWSIETSWVKKKIHVPQPPRKNWDLSGWPSLWLVFPQPHTFSPTTASFLPRFKISNKQWIRISRAGKWTSLSRTWLVTWILQARILEWGTHSLLQGISQTRDWNPGVLHHRQILYQLSHQEAQEYWNGQFLSTPGDLPDPGIKRGLLQCRQILYQLS